MKSRSAYRHIRLVLVVSGMLLLLLGMGLLTLSMVPFPTSGSTVQLHTSIKPVELAAEQGVAPQDEVSPTYVVYGNQLESAAATIAAILPTASPMPDEPTYRQHGYQSEDLWRRAFSTARALYPPPPDLDVPVPTPIPHVGAWPTQAEPPHHTTTNGTVYDSGNSDPPCDRIRTSNYWIGTVNGQDTDVCAGITKDNPGTSVIALWVKLQPGQPRAMLTYIVPTDASGVWITDEVGGYLTLRSNLGMTYYFDLTTRQRTTMAATPSPPSPTTPVASPSP